MDDPHIQDRELDAALRGLERLNFFSAVTPSLWNEIAPYANGKDLKILDVACASGDVLRGLAIKCGAGCTLHGCDINERSLRIAREKTEEGNLNVHYYTLNALLDPISEHYDIITCNLFLHHLARDEAKLLISRLVNSASKVVIFSDLLRTSFGYYLAVLATRLLTRSAVVHFDGPVSVRQAFTIPEIEKMLQELNIGQYQIRKQWPCRFMLIIEGRRQ